MEKRIMGLIDEGCIPTINKYEKGQLIGAIFNYITKEDTKAFTGDSNSRRIIEQVGVNNFIEALLEHVVKLNALYDINRLRFIYEFSKDYSKHTVGESELRIYETLLLSVNDVFNNTAITDAITIITKDEVALYNIITSFVDFRYLRAKAYELDTNYVNNEIDKQIIWKIEEYFTSIN